MSGFNPNGLPIFNPLTSRTVEYAPSSRDPQHEEQEINSISGPGSPTTFTFPLWHHGGPGVAISTDSPNEDWRRQSSIQGVTMVTMPQGQTFGDQRVHGPFPVSSGQGPLNIAAPVLVQQVAAPPPGSYPLHLPISQSGISIVSSNGVPGTRFIGSDGRATQLIFRHDPLRERNSNLPAIMTEHANFMEQLRNAGSFLRGLPGEWGSEQRPPHPRFLGPLVPPLPMIPAPPSAVGSPSPAFHSLREGNGRRLRRPSLPVVQDPGVRMQESLFLDPVSRSLLVSYLRSHPYYNQIGDFARTNYPSSISKERFRFFNSSPRPDGPQPEPLTMNNVLNIWRNDYLVDIPRSEDYIGYMCFAGELQVIELGIVTLGEEYLERIRDAGDRGGTGLDGIYTQMDIREKLNEKIWLPVRRRFFREVGTAGVRQQRSVYIWDDSGSRPGNQEDRNRRQQGRGTETTSIITEDPTWTAPRPGSAITDSPEIERMASAPQSIRSLMQRSRAREAVRMRAAAAAERRARLASEERQRNANDSNQMGDFPSRSPRGTRRSETER